MKPEPCHHIQENILKEDEPQQAANELKAGEAWEGLLQVHHTCFLDDFTHSHSIPRYKPLWLACTDL